MANQASSKPTRKLWTSVVGAILTAIIVVAAGLDLGPETVAMIASLTGGLIGYLVPPAAADQIQDVYEDVTGA